MLKIGGIFDYEYEIDGKTVIKQKRLNIIHFRFSISLGKNRIVNEEKYVPKSDIK